MSPRTGHASRGRPVYLRTDPRFKVIVRDLGLVDYWRASDKWGDFCKPSGKDDFECH